jgi:nucleoside-diphosphate-sugar epimerase
MREDQNKKLNVLVTGGSGFLGKAIVRELLEPSSLVNPTKIRIFDLKDPESDKSDPRIEFVKGEIRDKELVLDAC